MSYIFSNLTSSLSSFSLIPSSVQYHTAFSKVINGVLMAKPRYLWVYILGLLFSIWLSDLLQALYAFGCHTTRLLSFHTSLTIYFFFLKATSSAYPFRICISRDSVLSPSSPPAYFFLHKFIQPDWFQSHCSTSGHIISSLDLCSSLLIGLPAFNLTPSKPPYTPLSECQCKAAVPKHYYASGSLGGIKIQIPRAHS